MSTLSDIRIKIICATVILSGLWLFASAQDYEVEEVSFNSAYSDFAPVRYRDGVVFCSSREKKKLAYDEDSVNFYTDMFFVRLKSNNTWSNPAIFSDALTGYLNEGPATFTQDEKTIYYTTNIEPKDPNKKERVDEYKLGIWIAVHTDQGWVKKEAFPFNSPKTTYNVAHPALSPNDSVLYFVSNMPGGLGGMDIYKCIWSSGRWSQPINLGATVNTKGDELFPFINDNNILFFTTNGRNERGRKDTEIYSCEISSHGYSEAMPMPYPVNTEFDDFAYSEYNGDTFGFLCSNRSGKDGIYSFRMDAPNFFECKENERPYFCYEISDNKIEPIDSLPLVYEWDLGDGTRKRGLTVEHCYATYGNYKVNLNIIDTITNSIFYAVSQTEIAIEDFQRPYILSNDSVVVNTPLKLFADVTGITQFEVERQYWIVDNGAVFHGDTLPYTFTEPGYHTVICGAISKMAAGGRRMKSCSYKEIYVLPESAPGFPQPDPDPSIVPVKHINLKTDIQAFATKSDDRKLAAVYSIVLARSVEQLKADDPLFTQITHEIIETRSETGEYVYSVGATPDVVQLYSAFQELQDESRPEVEIITFNEEQLRGVDWNAFRERELIHEEVVDFFNPVSETVASPEANALNIEASELEGTEEQTASQPEVEAASLSPEMIQEVPSTTPDVTPARSESNLPEPVTAPIATRIGRVEADSAQTASLKLYHVVLLTSSVRIPFNDPAFSKVDSEIVESKNEDGDFQYAVGVSDSEDELEPLLQKMISKGFVHARIAGFYQLDYSKVILRTGRYIEHGNADKLNIEFAKLRDIKFEYNSDVIREESKEILDYLAAMLILEENFQLKINAHTCSIGGHHFNMELSEKRAKSVIRYLTEKGIDGARLHPKGFAETQPIADNDTENGRAQNRRVEFIIVFTTN